MDLPAYPIQSLPPVAPRPIPKAEPVPPVDSVGPKDGLAEGQLGPRQDANGGDQSRQGVVERDVTIDPDTQTMVYQALNARGEVVLQVPDQIILRQRAYDRESAAEDKTASGPHGVELRV